MSKWDEEDISPDPWREDLKDDFFYDEFNPTDEVIDFEWEQDNYDDEITF